MSDRVGLYCIINVNVIMMISIWSLYANLLVYLSLISHSISPLTCLRLPMPDRLSELDLESCACGRSFTWPNTLTNHIRTCKNAKKRLSSVLDHAKQRWTVRKCQHIALEQPSNSRPGTCVLGSARLISSTAVVDNVSAKISTGIV